MKRTLGLSIATLALCGLMTVPGYAETFSGHYASHSHAGPRVRQVTQREHNQQRRIHQGVRSGELTRREAANLQRHARRIHRNKQRAMARNHGHLTRHDHIRLNRELDSQSQRIYAKKHNARRRY